MIHRYRFICGAFIFFCAGITAVGQSISPVPQYSPPDIVKTGEAGYYKDLAIIETSCTTNEDVKTLWQEVTTRGALIGIITSPQRMLAWVPPQAKSAVQSARIQSALGEKGVLSISYTVEEFRMNSKGIYTSAAQDNEADEAIVGFLEFIRRPKTQEEIDLMQQWMNDPQRAEYDKPLTGCMQVSRVEMNDLPTDKSGNKIFGGPGSQIMRASKIEGLIAHSSFFPESRTGTGTQNWDNAVYTRYRDFYIAGLLYWTSFASKYGRSATSFWRLYGPTHSYCQVSGEPIVIKEDSFVSQIMNNIGVSSPSTWATVGRAARYCQPYNDYIRGLLGAAEAISGFICYRGAPGGTGDTTGVWPHAIGIIWGGVDYEGVYFAMDTQYGQAGLDPWRAPYRNVCAHEIGHLWGAPDEYVGDAGCFTWMYRGARNINCQQPQPALGRPGLTMRGGEGIMVSNYTGGTSIATPVHTGILAAGSMSPIRCFATQPPGDSLILYWCGYDQRVVFTPLCMPLDYDFCMDVWAPNRRRISGVDYLFDYWELRYRDGTVRNITDRANRLPSFAYSSSRANAVTDIKAVYTSTPPDINIANNTLSAWLAPGDNSASPPRALAVKWINRWDMNRTETKVEFEQSPGTWVEVIPSLAPFHVNVSDWTGVFIDALPRAGGGVDAIQANRTYRFRIVGYFNTVRGAPSTPASITTRPSAPRDTIFCNDNYEPNESTSQRLISPPDTTELVEINAACPMSPRSAEFTWFTPKNDYYRIIINPGTSDVRISLVRKPGSYFKPKFRAQPVLSFSHFNSTMRNDTAFLTLSAGTYIIKVEPEITGYPSTSGSYLIDPNGGHFGFGEYKLIMQRIPTFRWTFLPPLCSECYRLIIPRPDPSGLFVIRDPRNAIREAAIKFDVFRKGNPRTPDSFFDIFFYPEPGFQFSFFDGDFGKFNQIPLSLQLGPNTPPRDFDIIANSTRIASDLVELVLIYPDGPDGVFERRVTKPIGTVEPALANPPADFNFIGWGGDSVATTNPLPVTLWHNKKLIAYWKKKPCNPDPMTAWVHKLNFVNKPQTNVVLEFGMQPGAGDGLEAGQPDLPPIPPSAIFDIRWVNITGSQGSTIDHRAVQPSFTFIGGVQTGTGNAPVNMSWSPPTTIPATANMIMKVAGDPTPINMRTTTNYIFPADGNYQIMIEVKEGCPEPTKESDVRITTTSVNTKNFPCVELELLVSNRLTGDPLPFYNPYNLKVYEKDANGQEGPARIAQIIQRETTFIFRICSDRTDTNPNREIVVRDENNNDPDKKKETVNIDIPIPVPQGSGNLVRLVQQRSRNWQLASLPLDIMNTEVSTIFSDPATTLYSFNTTTGTYDPQSMMTFGWGYWLRTLDASSLFYGLEKINFVFSGLNGVGEPFGFGWNLIGSVSKSLAVSAIVQNPPGGMLSIFGWDPASGYLLPAVIKPGEGYWVRVNPGTTLRMTGTGFTGGEDEKTAYQKISDKIDVAGKLFFTTERNETHSLLLSATQITPEEKNILQLPLIPPADVLDVRTGEGSRYAFNGENMIQLQAQGKVSITCEQTFNHEVTCVLLNDRDEALGEFDNQHRSSIPVDVKGKASLKLNVFAKNTAPRTMSLGQNYPNPFSFTSTVSTLIPYTVEKSGMVDLSIYDVLGRKIRTLVSGDRQTGSYSVEWDGRNTFGLTLPTGMYIYRLESNGRILSKTLSVVK